MSSPALYFAAALASSASWALGAILWKKLGDRLTPGGMNFAKVVLGSALMACLIPFAESVALDARSVVLLGMSGLLGVAVGDTCFFFSLVKLGPRRASLMGALNPVCVALGSVLFLNERPPALAWLGIVGATLGVSWVLYERTPTREEQRNQKAGVVFGLLSVLCTTASVLLAKIGLAGVPSVQGTMIRLLWAAAGLLAFGLASRKMRLWLAPLQSPPLLARVSGVVAVVVIGGFWLSLLALKHLDASIAGTLTSAAPIFILPLAHFLLKERVSLRASSGALVALGGIALLFATRGFGPAADARTEPAGASSSSRAEPHGQDGRLTHGQNGRHPLSQTRREKLRHRQETSSQAFWDVLAIQPGMTVLDIGAGTGQQAMAMAEKLDGTGRVFATDVKPGMVEAMKKGAAYRGLKNVTPVLVSAPGLDPFYFQQTYDLILMNNTHPARHVDETYFAQLHPLLKPRGRLVQNLDYPRPFYPPFAREDFTDLRGFMAALAAEPPESPYLDVLPAPLGLQLAALQGAEPEPELAEAVIKALNAALLDPQFLFRFVDHGKFIDDTFPSELEADRATLLLDSLTDHVRVSRTSIWIEDACRLNNRLFVRRFQPYLDPVWLAPNWRGKSYGEAWTQRLRNLELLQKAGWSLKMESWDIVPYHYVWVLQ